MKVKPSLSIDEVKHLAKLSNLKLTEAELEKYQKQLEETVEFVKNLNELKTENVIPTSTTTNLKNVYFKDGVKNKRCLSRDKALANSKKKKGNFFVVKRIL